MLKNEQYVEMMKKLVSALEGAPFPTNVTDELYEIWYEHSRQVTSEALQMIAKVEKQA